MKKLLFLLLVLVLPQVKAEVIYSEYGEYMYSDEYVKSSDLIEVYEEKVYLWAKEEKKYLDYVSLDSNHLVDYSDCILKENDWSYERSSVTSNSKEVIGYEYTYEILNQVKYIVIDEIYGDLGNLVFKEIEINSKYVCLECEDYISLGINNSKQDDLALLENGGKLILELDESKNINELITKLYVFDEGNVAPSYKLSYLDIDNNLLFSKEIKYNANQLNQEINIGISVLPSHIDENLLTKNIISYSPLNIEYLKLDVKEIYKYFEYVCREYEVEVEISDDYYTFIEGYDIKLEEKIIYKYRIRNKLQFNNIVITTPNFNLTKLITSNVDYEISSNINYEENGVYQIYIFFDGYSFKRDIILNISRELNLNDEIKEVVIYEEPLCEESINIEREEKQFTYFKCIYISFGMILLIILVLILKKKVKN